MQLACFADCVAKSLPRLLALLAGLPIAIFLLTKTQLPGLGLATVLACAIVFFGVVFRRTWGLRRGHRWVTNWRRNGSESTERFDDLSRGAWFFIGLLFALSFGIWLALPIWMESFARWVGAPALLLFALMSWTVFGGFILTYLPKSYHIPSLNWIAALALFFCWRWNENHLVAPPAAGIVNGPRPELGATFVDWLRHRAEPAGAGHFHRQLRRRFACGLLDYVRPRQAGG